MTDNPDPAGVVADADVLVADLLVGGDARRALDSIREHSWVTLYASDSLLDDAEAVIAELADADLATDWREKIEPEVELVDHPDGDQPALAAAYQGNAAHVLTFDDGLTTAEAGMTIRTRIQVSIKQPDAFAALFDPESLYDAVVGGEYPGPDRDPRA